MVTWHHMLHPPQVRGWRDGSTESCRSTGKGHWWEGMWLGVWLPVWPSVSCRHELQHFIDVMEGYIANQLFYLSWGEFEEDLANNVRPPLSLSLSPPLFPPSPPSLSFLPPSLPLPPSLFASLPSLSSLPLLSPPFPPSPPLPLCSLSPYPLAGHLTFPLPAGEQFGHSN